MWVLEARKNAEKITYPVVWEGTKYADNVIDYDIREEQTKDISAEINANNQTTTGMATVIPWVNAPKLLESTSIISNKEVWYIYAYISMSWKNYVTVWEYVVVWNAAFSDQVWEPQFTKTSNNWYAVVPADWIYQLDITRPYWWYNWCRDTTLRTSKQWTIKSDYWALDTTHTDTIKIALTKWEQISWYTYLRWTTTWQYIPRLYIAATRLW